MKNKKGVTQASQRRWVEYYQQVLEKRALGEPLVRSTPAPCTPPGIPSFAPRPSAHLLHILSALHPSCAPSGAAQDLGA